MFTFSLLVSHLWLWPIILVLLTILKTFACLWRAAWRISDDVTISMFWKMKYWIWHKSENKTYHFDMRKDWAGAEENDGEGGEEYFKYLIFDIFKLEVTWGWWWWGGWRSRRWRGTSCSSGPPHCATLGCSWGWRLIRLVWIIHWEQGRLFLAGPRLKISRLGVLQHNV